MKTIAKRLRRAREDAGLSQEEVANKLDLGSHAAYGNYERGITEPNIDNLMKLTRIFGKPLNWFLDVENGVNLSPDEVELLDAYRQLPYDAKRYALGIIQDMAKRASEN